MNDQVNKEVVAPVEGQVPATSEGAKAQVTLEVKEPVKEEKPVQM